jgi:hypothetical protein
MEVQVSKFQKFVNLVVPFMGNNYHDCLSGTGAEG